MDEFDALWAEDEEQQVDNKEDEEEETPEYQIRDGIAKSKLLSNLIMFYYYAKYGEPMVSNTFSPQLEDIDVNFYLKK